MHLLDLTDMTDTSDTKSNDLIYATTVLAELLTQTFLHESVSAQQSDQLQHCTTHSHHDSMKLHCILRL